MKIFADSTFAYRIYSIDYLYAYALWAVAGYSQKRLANYRVGDILCQTASVFPKLSGSVGVKSHFLNNRLERILLSN